jgi:serine/threonine protein kinase
VAESESDVQHKECVSVSQRQKPPVAADAAQSISHPQLGAPASRSMWQATRVDKRVGGLLAGTPYYLAPEVCNGQRYDSSCDVW